MVTTAVEGPRVETNALRSPNMFEIGLMAGILTHAAFDFATPEQSIGMWKGLGNIGMALGGWYGFRDQLPKTVTGHPLGDLAIGFTLGFGGGWLVDGAIGHIVGG